MEKRIHGEPSAGLRSDLVEVWVTRRGGQMAPVWFDVGAADPVCPYSLPPWTAAECAPETPALLQVLRGDFFCLPFGESRCTPHPHGAVANAEWELSVDADRLCLEGRLGAEDLGAQVNKEIRLRPGERVLYVRHTIAGLDGRFNLGHHPVLEFPAEAGPCALRTGPIRYGQVYPGEFEGPGTGGSSALKAGARFRHLGEVELAAGGTTSLEDYPARKGNEDLVLFSAADSQLGWVAVHFPGYVWMALKNPAHFPSTLLWHSNGGRPFAPWNGKHVRRMGIEDVCSYFHEGVEASREKDLEDPEIPTTHPFTGGRPRSFPHLQLVHPLPADWGTVASARAADDQRALILTSSSGREETVPVDVSFLREEP